MKLPTPTRLFHVSALQPMILLGLLLALSAAANAMPTDTCPISEGRWGGGPPRGIERWTGGSEDLLAVGAGAELVLFNINTPTTPVELGRVLIGHLARNVTISADGTLVAASDSSNNLSLVDISQRSAPVLRGSYAWAGLQQPTGMAFRGNHLYVAVRTLGLAVLDITDPDSPTFVANSDGAVTDYVFDVALRGDYAYLAQRADGVQVVDISDPSDPRVVGNHAASAGVAKIDIVGNRAYVARGSAGFSILDLTSPIAPILIGEFDTAGYAYDTVLLPGDRLAVSQGSGGIDIFDISTPATPVEVGGTTAFTVAGRLVALDDRIFSVSGGDYVRPLRLIDFQTPTAPVEVGHVDFDGDSATVSVGAGHVLVANKTGGVVMLDSSNPVAPYEIGRVDIGREASRVGHVNGYGLATGTNNKMINVIDPQPTGPVVVTTIDNLYGIGDFKSDGTRLYVASGQHGGLRIHDMSNPLMPQLLGALVPAGKTVWKIAVSGNYVYAGWVNAPDLLVIDVSNPTAPVTVGSPYTLPGGATDIAASGSTVFVGTKIHGVRILQNNGFGTLTEIADIQISPASVTGVRVEDDMLYISAGVFSGLLIYDVSNPASPQFVEQHNTTGEGLGVDVMNGVIAIAEGSSGVSVLGCDAASTNQPPVTVGVIGNQDSDEGETIFPLSVNANFSDPDGQALTYTATGLPPGLAIGFGSGVIEGSLNYFSAGSYSVVVTATDPFALSVSQSFSWTVNNVNAAPIVVSNIPNQYNDEGDTVSLDVHARFTDPDGETLRFEAGSLPQGLSIGASSGIISGTLGTQSSGSYTVLVAAFDPQDALATQTFSWVVHDNSITVFSDGFE